MRVGTKVRVLEIAAALKRDLPPDEVECLESMVGHVFEVYAIDAYDKPWVRKWWNVDEHQAFSHSLALDPCECEVVS